MENCKYCKTEITINNRVDVMGEILCKGCALQMEIEYAEFELKSAAYRVMELRGLIDEDMRKPSAPVFGIPF